MTFELLGFGANGWGAALLRAALMTLALSGSGFLSGVVLGAGAMIAAFWGDGILRWYLQFFSVR